MPIFLDETSKRPLYMQIYDKLRADIVEGRLAPSQKLPSKRRLAEQLCVSVNTVDSAYAQLSSEGFIESSARRGFFVSSFDELSYFHRSPKKALISAENSLLKHAPREEIHSKPCPAEGENGAVNSSLNHSQPCEIDFSPDGIARERFPYGVWRRLLRSCFNEYDPRLLRRPPSQGEAELRKEIARYLAASRGVNVSAEQVIVAAGTDNLLYIVSYILDNSYSIAVENPVYNRAYKAFERMGHSVFPVLCDSKGVRPDKLPNCKRITLYTTPSHQFPLGFSMPVTRRAALLDWASAAEGRYIIEDDYDSEFRYGARPIPALRSIDSLGRVIYLGSFSRSIAPSLRLGYLVLPPELKALYDKHFVHFSSQTSGFEQLVLCEFLKSGAFETHVNKMRVRYKNLRQSLINSLGVFGESLQIIGENAGHHLCVRLKNGLKESEMCRLALHSGVRVYPVSPYFIGGTDKAYTSTVILGYGGLSESDIARGVGLLHSAWLA